MKNYNNYSLEDFVQDPYFRQWVLGTLGTNDLFWDEWIKANPDKEILLNQASSMVLGLDFEAEEVGRNEITAAITKIQSRLHTRRPFYLRNWFSLAAALAIGIGLLVVWKLTDLSSYLPGSLSNGASTTLDIRWQTNNSTSDLSIRLRDGSTVILTPQSRLGITSDFGADSRTVLLEGEATFDVIRNPELPFIVNSHGILTKVLGTVFKVRAWNEEENVAVSVQSGKVTVQKATDHVGEPQKTQETILTPNQQVVISKVNDRVIKTLVENPGIIREPELHRHFSFNDTPIQEVFKTLEQAYGIRFEFDERKLSKCNLTAKLSNEDLFDQLDMICETIQASYRIADGQILVDGNGCE